MQKIDDILKEMANDLPGVVAIGVIGMDGLGIAHYQAVPGFDVEIADSQFAVVMKLVQKTCKQLGEDEMEDNLVTTDDLFILCRFIGDGSYYLGISANQKEANLGNVRLIARQYDDLIWDNIPKRKK